MAAVIALLRNDLVLYFSSRRALLMNILAPILIAAFFGALFDSDASKAPTRIPVAVVDLDHSEISGRIVAAMQADTAFDIRVLDAAGIMTRSPVSVSPEALIQDALRLMEDRPSQISVLPVVDEQRRCIGLLRIHDLYWH